MIHIKNEALTTMMVTMMSIVSSIPAYSQDKLDYGIFDNSTDIGQTDHAGKSTFNADSKGYRISGSGDNVWAEKDAFQFLWKKITGDVTITAKVNWIGEGSHPHRKAGLMIRQNLNPDSPYVDAVVHGDGLTSLQYRTTPGGPTAEIPTSLSAPSTLRLQRDGDVFTMSISSDGKEFLPVGSLSVPLNDPVYIGLLVCSHDNSVLETAVFTNVDMKIKGLIEQDKRILESTLEIISIETAVRRIVHRSLTHFEAPNWSPDGRYLVFNSKGRLYKITPQGGAPEIIDTGIADRCNNDHGFSRDGKWLAISHHMDQSMIFILPGTGGTPRQVTPMGPSYWHGWSPDGGTLAYCAERNGNYDIYTIPVEGGKEIRLTDADGLDDGPDYSPDGRYIYFNSVRTGLMKIWRMDSNGDNQQQVTSDEQYADWFPHPSPDGKHLVFLSYNKDVEGHPANKDVALRILPLSGGNPKILARLFGGQGTINVPSWSPDSKQVAFVSYRLIAPEH